MWHKAGTRLSPTKSGTTCGGHINFCARRTIPRASRRNVGIGHGWVEGGPLLPVKNEYYQAGLAVEALRALSNLAQLLGKDDISKQASAEFEQKKPALEQAFWAPETNAYAFALKQDNQRANEVSVLTTVPMWFGLPDADHADSTITQLAAEQHQTDWGMRIISDQSKLYDGSGYHYGAVWPLFTGWASVGEYRYHHAFPAYSNLRSNALLGLDGALGHFTEVLSGDYYQSFATSSPHQIWSAAMVVSPILRGMLGLQADARAASADIRSACSRGLDCVFCSQHARGEVGLDLQYRKTTDSLTLEVKRTGNGDCSVEFSPAFSLRTQVLSVEMNGRSLPFKVRPNRNDQHLSVRFPVDGGPNVVVVHVKNDFGLALSNELPPLGSASRGLRVVSESWNQARTEVTLETSGRGGSHYEMNVWNPAQIASAEGAVLTKAGKLEITMPAGQDSYVPQKVVIHFAR